ncbi:MAG: DUF1080 domain-containing protein [Bacteroidota bacterium]
METALPFTPLGLDTMDSFRPVAKNWQIVGDVYVDQTQKRTFVPTPGTGILLNSPEKGMKENLFTTFEHGDLELEMDVMMPVHSNSGLYFMGRYELQLLDSWGKEPPQHSDIGGIYQRWDNTREKGKRGFEGHPPKVNAAKAPGLWQHFKVKFLAPRFDSEGNKIENARFGEVWLNGILIHENQEVTGPTRAATFQDEQAKGPLMIQGDHGPVAIKNMAYKLQTGQKIGIPTLSMKEYSNTALKIPNLDTLALEREIQADSLSALMVSGNNSQKILAYSGTMEVPVSGEYLFDMMVSGGGALLLINKDTVADLNGDFFPEDRAIGRAQLQKGQVPFTFIYNKHRPYRSGFELFVEGPGIAKYSLHAPGSIKRQETDENRIVIEPNETETVLQRGFLMHEGQKRTHTISVATPQGIHYAFDLATGTLLLAWGGEFLDVTKMWFGRGGQQLETPLGLAISIHGDPDFAFLENEKTSWPDSIPQNTRYRQLGYELDKTGTPEFGIELDQTVLTNKFVPTDSLRRLQRFITVDADTDIWHKLAEGSRIEALAQNTYGIDDKQYFLDFSGNAAYTPVIRESRDGGEELLVKIPKGEQKLAYILSW